MRRKERSPDSPLPVTRKLRIVIRRWREARGWTQEMLADKAGLSAMTIHYIETGRRMPTMDSVERIARAFGTAVPTLILEATLER